MISALALGCAAPALGDPAAELFQENCATCHGASAQGDGPMAAILTVDVPDLTQLAARNGGAFPFLDVIEVVDGRRMLTGHGGPMPIYGYALVGDAVALDTPYGGTITTSVPIRDLVQWLADQQR